MSEFKIYLLSSIADVLTKIMSSVATVIVIPEVVPCPGEEWVMVLSHHKAVLAMVVVGLAISPVKPINCGVHVLPHPVSRGSLTVSLLQWAKIFITNIFKCSILKSLPQCGLQAKIGHTLQPLLLSTICPSASSLFLHYLFKKSYSINQRFTLPGLSISATQAPA